MINRIQEFAEDEARTCSQTQQNSAGVDVWGALLTPPTTPTSRAL